MGSRSIHLLTLAAATLLLTAGCSALTGFGDLDLDGRDAGAGASDMLGPDVARRDASDRDAATPEDASGIDASPASEAGSPDAGPRDAATPEDAGGIDASPASEAGSPDAGPRDAGSTDLGPEDAMSEPPDAGSLDAGPPLDASTTADTGRPDMSAADGSSDPPDMAVRDAGPDVLDAGCSGCRIGGTCVPGGTPHPTGCGICDPANSATSWTELPNGTSCDDGLACSADSACNGSLECLATTMLSCSDGLACTTDGCNEGALGCVYTPTPGFCVVGMPSSPECATDGQQNPTNECERCDDGAPYGWTWKPNGAACGVAGLQICCSGSCRPTGCLVCGSC